VPVAGGKSVFAGVVIVGIFTAVLCAHNLLVGNRYGLPVNVIKEASKASVNMLSASGATDGNN
jgi:hypothetical protein